MAEPSDSQVRAVMKELVGSVDVDSITMKQFIAQLSKKMGGVDLKPRKKYIKTTLTELIDEMNKGNDEDAASSAEEEVVVEPKKRGAGGLGAEKEISPELKDFLGTEKTKMARTEIVKALWDHIKEHDLQNPQDKREILLDEAMQRLFGVERFSMFHMAKYVGAHVHPFKPVDLTPKEKDPEAEEKKKRKRENAKAKKDEAKGKKKRKKKEPGEKRKPPASFTAPYRLSPELIDVVGESVLSRPQVTSKLWEYIKANNLQLPSDKRTILCDDKFKIIMDGNERITMFQMNKYVSAHLIEKLEVPKEEEKPLKEESEEVEEEEDAETEEEEDED